MENGKSIRAKYNLEKNVPTKRKKVEESHKNEHFSIISEGG